MKKILNIVLIALIAIAVVPLFLWIFGVFGAFEHDPAVFGGADIMLGIAVAYLALAALAVVVMLAMNAGKSRSNSKIGLFVYGALAVLAVIVYFTIAKDTPVVGADKTVFDNSFELKITDTMLWLAYISVSLTVLALIFGAIRKAIK